MDTRRWSLLYKKLHMHENPKKRCMKFLTILFPSLFLFFDDNRFSATKSLNSPRSKRIFCTKSRTFVPLRVINVSLHKTRLCIAGIVTMNGLFAWSKPDTIMISAKDTGKWLSLSALGHGLNNGMKTEKKESSTESRNKYIPIYDSGLDFWEIM